MNINNIQGSLNRQAVPKRSSENKAIREKPAKYPIFLSAAVYPGAGQIFQRRITVGIFFITTFSITFIAFLILMGSIIVDFYSIGLNFDNAQINAEPSITPALSAFGVTLLIYIINLIDTHATYRKQLIEAGKKVDIMDLMDSMDKM